MISAVVTFLATQSAPAFARYTAPTTESILGKCQGNNQTTCVMKAVQNVMTNDIPKELKTANCGYPLPEVPENDKITLVKGLPIVPFQFRGTSPSMEGTEDGFPTDTKGYSFAWGKNPETGPPKFMPWCSAQSKDKHLCHTPETCQANCKFYNGNSFKFNVYRHTWCWQDVFDIVLQINVRVYERTEDQMTDCDSCKPGWHQLEPPSTYNGEKAYKLVGEKYICTGDYHQQVDVGYNLNVPGLPTIPFSPKWIQLPDGFEYVNKPIKDLKYGWVWNDKTGEPKLDLPNDDCKAFWKGVESEEHPNCVICTGSECRTEPPKGPPYDPGEGKNAVYKAFFRRYEGSHVLKYIKGAETKEAMEEKPKEEKKKKTEEEVGTGYLGDDAPETDKEKEAAAKKKEEEEKKKNSSVKVGCYGWYTEPQSPSIFPDKTDLNCVADDLRLTTVLNQRKMTLPESDLPVQFNLKDNLPTPPKDAPAGGYSLESAKKTFTWLFTAIPPKVIHRTPFGEQPWYVTEMRRLQQKMKDYPPTVQVILPTLEANEKSLSMDSSSSSSASSDAPLIDMTVPLEPGLVEVIRDFLHQSLLSRLEEQTIPVVLPMLSEEEIQSALQAWETWKKSRLLAEKTAKDGGKSIESAAGKADQIITKLQEYRSSIHRYRILRAMLPEYLAYLLTERKKLTDALDEWINSRMEPYTQALGEREQMLGLLSSWEGLEYAYTNLGVTNSRYCKADATTPPLPWIMEAADARYFSFPEVPSYPRHMVFDFSDIFFDGAKQIVSMPTPVLELVRVTLNIPMPPPPDTENVSIPNLPSLPQLPAMPAPSASLVVQKNYKSEAVPPPFPYDELKESFDIAAGMINYETKLYNEYLWVKATNKKLSCLTLGSDGCVFPETYLWHVFMRIWSPVGAFLKSYPVPETPEVAKNQGFMGYASSLSSDPPCAPLDDQCQMRESLVRKSLRITLPTSASASSVPETGSGLTAADRLRSILRLKTLDQWGRLIPQVQNLYKISGPQELYDSFPVPLEATIDYQPPL